MRPIDADELLGIEKILSLGVRSTEAKVLMEQVIFDIQQSPTINSEGLRPKGKWEAPEEHGFSLKVKGKHLGTICSCCCSWSDNQYDFCPNCGAKMEE